MRTVLLLGLVSVIAATSVACAVEETGGSGSPLRRTHKTADDGDDDDDSADHDSEPTVGEFDSDPGNPNANKLPSTPTTTGTASAKFAVAVTTNTPVADLGKDTELDVTITPTGGFTGPVNLAVTGLPTGVTAPPVVATVSGAGVTTAKVKLAAGYGAPVSSADVPLTITGTSGALTSSAPANFKVTPKVVLTIPMNIDALRAAGANFRDDWGAAFGAKPTTLLTQANNPIVVTVFNADSKSHIVHGNAGFAHGDTKNPIAPNSFELQNGANRVRSLKPGAKTNGYPHDGTNGVGASFQIIVGTAP